MSRTTSCFCLVAAVLLAGELPACGPPASRHYPRQVGGTETDAGQTGGTGMEPEPTATGGKGTGGSVGTGGAAETGGAGGGGATGTGGVPMVDAALDTGGAGGSLPPDAAASTPDLPGTGGATGGTGGAPGPGTGGQGGRDAGPIGPANMAYCHPDPSVIQICKQLEPACLNCPSNSDRCFTVADDGDDRACARYAADNKCTVDVGGNWCGSLNCMAQGCDRSACSAAQSEGSSPECQKLMAKCPCK